MSNYPVLIVADSRGRLLEQELQFELYDINYQLIWVKGLRLINTGETIYRAVLRYKPKLIYLLNGVCDITFLRSREPRLVAMPYSCARTTTAEYITAADQLHAELFSLSSRVGHYIMVIFSTQTGMDLSYYNGYPRELTSPEQGTMNLSIAMINRRIFAMNRSVGIITPYLSSAVHVRCRGRYRFMSDKLADGCHPTRQLCREWATKLRRNILANLNGYDHYSLRNSMYS